MQKQVKVTLSTPIHEACDTESSRYALDSVLVDPTIGRAVATNGRILAVADVEVQLCDDTEFEPLDNPKLVPHSILKGGSAKDRKLTLNGNVKRSEPKKNDTIAEYVDGRFPDVGQVLAKPELTTARLGISAGQLFALAKAISPHGEKELGVDLEFQVDSEGHAVGQIYVRPTNSNGTNAAGLLMPMTIDFKNSKRPYNAIWSLLDGIRHECKPE